MVALVLRIIKTTILIECVGAIGLSVRFIPKYGPERPGDIYKSALANTRARRGLGWKPSVSLEEGLRRTYEYFVEKADIS